jgi:hypothetical protein
LKSVISGPATSAALTARTVGAYYAAQLAAGLGGRLDAVDQMPGMVRLQTTVSIRGT